MNNPHDLMLAFLDAEQRASNVQNASFAWVWPGEWRPRSATEARNRLNWVVEFDRSITKTHRFMFLEPR